MTLPPIGVWRTLERADDPLRTVATPRPRMAGLAWIPALLLFALAAWLLTLT